MSRKPSDVLGIDPSFRYTLTGFKVAAGIGDKLIAAAAKRGVELKRRRVGRRDYVHGADGIEYLDRLAELPQPICQ
ncbi:hypothetical protein [Aeoliella sp.]|uniref:hypothetical protein n=1 Tax=Aeoliella sp. TaxID=2795800 RepID=UPI003CCB7C64